MAPLISLLSPYASSLTSVLLIDYGIQALGFSISAPLRTEKLFDLAGAVSYVSAVAASVLFRPEGDVLSRRQVLAAAMTTLWAFRLGSFLFVRVFFKSDKRFDKIKHNTKRFALTWVLQGVWVYITALPVYILLANPGASQRPLQITDYVGAGLWATGFLIEAVADAQKFAFKNKHPHKFMSTGLFRYSRCELQQPPQAGEIGFGQQMLPWDAAVRHSGDAQSICWKVDHG
ncbi:uncharacterized protein BJ171DRAFT_539672 [Polychytrium aggregatum]|uniref:uncharacterized protein n=1 Tax=Polychytrium aggregatum TaxID=110093 RepID=UPI0022FE9943|nr:uncharacterized protein BJ171DRAFT_539672 [Polychytrium aggregatum]KAI9190822.1 hypothetical protein BJ171DRAFT_539672 [Polychytrium aggregatum]